jgi:eukaryotic-like serine/threonine-protein kinase
MPAEVRPCPACDTPLPFDAQFCLRCGVATPTDPGVPPRTAATGVVEVSQVKRALADRYRIERVLGEGGMATVYLAEDLKHHRKVAVKVMRPELAATLGSERFLREVQIAAQLSHPHILPVFDSGEAGALLYYVMPHVEGQTLRERLQQETQLPVDEALRLAREISEALAYAHARGIIHRDIKPGNVLLQSGHALVADFGIARALEDSGESLTQTGLAVGTPQYMAPEQASGDRAVDGRADIYAVGAVLYEMLAGEPPFTGPTPRAIVMRSMTEAPRSIASSRAGLSPAVETAVLKALAKSPADRFQTAAALADTLGRALDGVRSGTSPVPVSGGPSAAQVWGLFALGSIAMLGVAYTLIRRWNLPLWTLAFAVLLLAIGAGVLITTGRMEARRQAGGDAGGLTRWFTWRNAALGGGFALILWTGVATSFALKGPPGDAAADRTRVAIIPFTNQGAATDAYFADGISDEVRGKLAQVNGLTVIASSSAGQYRSSAKSPQEIARELGVGYLLVGKVRWSAGADGARRVQVVPELVNGSTGATAWQQTYDTDVKDVFQVQAQIASQVVAALGAQLGPQEQKQLAERPTANAAAYDLYLKGRALTSVDAGTQRQAAAYFEQAVALDSTFLGAWAWLSRSMSRVYSNGSRDPVAAARAREAMERTLALDSRNPAGLSAASRYYTTVAPDTAKARDAMDRALVLAPNDVDVLVLAAGVDLGADRHSEGVSKLERARELDPRSTAVLSSLQQAYVGQKRSTDAIAAGAAALALDPRNLNVIEYQVFAYMGQGNLDGAHRVVRAAISSGATAPAVAAFFAGYQEVSWALEPEHQQLLQRLTPAAFDNDRAWWGQSLATANWQQGDKVRARAYADSALALSTSQMNASPDDPQLRALYGLMLAFLGRAAEAREAGALALARGRFTTADSRNYVLLLHCRINLALGDTKSALDDIDTLLKRPSMLTPAWLRIDPTFASLKGNPRFEQLVRGPTGS